MTNGIVRQRWIQVVGLLAICCAAGCGGGGGDDSAAAQAPLPPAPTPTPTPTPVVVGLDQRPSNATCLAPARPAESAGVASEDAFPASPGFTAITKILQAPGDGARWFVLEQDGVIRVFDVADAGNPRVYLDINAISSVRSGGEEGLLGLAFHPEFPATPEIYVYYSSISGRRHSRLSRLILDDTASPTAAGTTEQILIEIDQPYANHNGGDIGFGPDGYLYAGLGDGGGGGDPDETAQDTTSWLGSMLRIDVLGVAHPQPGYVIPPDNPFAGNPKCGPTQLNVSDCPEIYAWGLRNPWRWSFDPATGKLWLGDVGQNAWEEVDIIERGGNYGWDCREGAHDFEPAGCATGGLIDPVSEYSHEEGQSITGGHVYRGTAIPGLAGRYVFADFVSGRIWALRSDGQGGYDNELLIDTNDLISAFWAGADQELYFADRAAGRIRRLVAAGPASPDSIADDLAGTGCVNPADPSQPAEGMVPYAINAPFWSDGAIKRRWMAVPDGATISIDSDDHFVFPAGSVLMKHFELNGQLIETRLLMRHTDGSWAGYSYAWNDSVTAATRVRGGRSRRVQGQDWIYPGEGECMQCHTAAAGFALGPEIAQLNRDFAYPSTGITANQLETLEHITILAAPLPGPAASLPAIPDPGDTVQPLADRARAYLHTNCAQCHRPGGPTPSTMDLRYTTALAMTNACGVAPATDPFGIGSAARLIAPGSPADSMIPARMAARDAHGMPPLGSSAADTAGIALISDWISALGSCN